MSRRKIFIIILLLVGMLVLGCVGREKPAKPTPAPTASKTPVPGETVSESEVSGIDNYSSELEKLISDTTELENIDLGLIDETTF